MKIVRIVLFSLIALFCLPLVIWGGEILIQGIRARGDVWSVHHEYFWTSGFLMIPALVAVLLAGLGAFRPRRLTGANFVFAFGILLYMAVAIPSMLSHPTSGASSSVLQQMRHLQTATEAWAEAQGKYPLTQQDLREAIQGGNLEASDSRFQRKGERLKYEYALTPGATGPVLRAERPAVIHYAVDSTGTHYWITGTVLPSAVADSAIVLRESLDETSPPRVIEGKLEPPAPATKPAPKK